MLNWKFKKSVLGCVYQFAGSGTTDPDPGPQHCLVDSVVDPGCLSRIPDPDFYPGSWFLPIPDPGCKNSNKREGWKKICCHNFLCSHKFHKIANYFSFEVLKKKIWANFQRIIELFTPKIVTKLSKIWIWDPGSGKNPDPGVKKAPDPGSRIRIRNTACRTTDCV